MRKHTQTITIQQDKKPEEQESQELNESLTQDLQALAAMRPNQPIQSIQPIQPMQPNQPTSTIPTTTVTSTSTQPETTTPNTSSQLEENHNLYEVGAKRSYLKSLWSTKMNPKLRLQSKSKGSADTSIDNSNSGFNEKRAEKNHGKKAIMNDAPESNENKEDISEKMTHAQETMRQEQARISEQRDTLIINSTTHQKNAVAGEQAEALIPSLVTPFQNLLNFVVGHPFLSTFYIFTIGGLIYMFRGAFTSATTVNSPTTINIGSLIPQPTIPTPLPLPTTTEITQIYYDIRNSIQTVGIVGGISFLFDRIRGRLEIRLVYSIIRVILRR